MTVDQEVYEFLNFLIVEFEEVFSLCLVVTAITHPLAYIEHVKRKFHADLAFFWGKNIT